MSARINRKRNECMKLPPVALNERLSLDAQLPAEVVRRQNNQSVFASSPYGANAKAEYCIAIVRVSDCSVAGQFDYPASTDRECAILCREDK
jgi:hypothetical protein